jgi:hypothetical protein
VEIFTVGLSNPGTVFKAGDVLSVQLQGTPGGIATASVSGRVAQGLALPENEPGVYQTEFTVPTGVEGRGLKIVGNLTRDGKKARPVLAAQTLTIDSTPPTFTAVAPEAGSSTNNTSPSIEVGYTDGNGSGMDLASLELRLDGRNVAADTAVGDEGAIYNSQDLSRGQHRVRALIRDLAGNPVSQEWTFVVGAAAAGVVTAVWHDARGLLLEGQTITVSARVADPGGVATFSIGDTIQELAMARDGNTLNYRGAYTVQPGDQVTDAEVTVQYRSPRNKQATMAATNRVSMDATLPNTLRITSPENGSAAGDVIQAAGVAPPGSTVRVTIGFKARLLTTVSGQLWQGNVKADDQGQWQTPEVSSEVFLGKASEYSVLARLLDATGAVVSESSVKLTK